MLKEERSKHGQTNNKAKQHSTPKAVTFPKKNELPRMGLEPTTLYTLDTCPGAKVRVITREARYYVKTRAFASFYAIISRAHAHAACAVT